MKAMILAAGLGTRLRPHTRYRPKGLFSLGETTLIDRLIDQLSRAGVSQVVINTHHLAHMIHAHVQQHTYPLTVAMIHEPRILGTGGGINNARAWLEGGPFVVINADIVTDIPLDEVLRFHADHPDPVTLVLIDHPPVNTVRIDSSARVIRFIEASYPGEISAAEKGLWWTFSGIQVLDPEIFDLLPDKKSFSTIDAYRAMIAAGRPVRAHLATDRHWCDIGTPERYRGAVFTHMAPRAFGKAFGSRSKTAIERQQLAGDGSQRRWERLRCGPKTLILGDHGIRSQAGVQEVDAYVAIGCHLWNHELPVPEIYAADRQAGLVFLEDLGDTNLQHFVLQKPGDEAVKNLYRRVIDHLRRLAFEGCRDFDIGWTWQTSHYDHGVIVKAECRYFLEAFINGYLGRSEQISTYAQEFDSLAEVTLRWQVIGLMHRDMQSRNIMLKQGRDPVFIDFQGARLGPVQYDLASLIIDPYAALDEKSQDALFEYARDSYAQNHQATRQHFENGFRYCCLTRNLQILGAFAFLSRQQGKTAFEAYLPRALWQLKRTMKQLPQKRWPKLEHLVDSL